ncbi:MAG TPA: ABC-F family ATP-binding cassette domain-containing protein [Anaerohalosphaeraceae bacterium]|jgi:ATP-binding cassette subfamily F protein 3|nr:ABC-F family ATP-binding cassette domain-containing protein [Anaerohalosphaeraceae bacterium]HRT48933.1 ABC-F family ATP-binding cassette domain-containing protein [Anaerohalosphaeraceae bacterium]HRT85056.1 ABC-F family ATP-binding cassette domain-containing protein [Anaerohalosphaeraceae bacterium]
MNVVSLQGVGKQFGHQVVFDGLNQTFFAGEKVGLIGPNGSGKTTLLRLILGEIEPDVGKVVRSKSLRIGYLPQEAAFDGSRTVMEEMHAGLDDVLGKQNRLHALAEHMETLHGAELAAAMAEYDRLSHEFETAGGYVLESRIKTILAGLEIDKELYHAKTSALSGGQLSRLGLAKVLLADTDLLLLDEPTNHLDLHATVWLERFIRDYKGAAIIISHDRYLLDAVTDKIVELDRGRSTTWTGNYSTYIETRRKVLLQKERQYQKRREMVDRTLDFIARNKDQEGMRKTARGRKKRLERLLHENPDFLEKPTEARTISFGFAGAKSQTNLVLRCESLTKAFGPVKLFENLTLDVLGGERLGITGPNGTGKTTFLRMALGQIQPATGTIRMGSTLSVGYLDQQAQVLDPERAVLDEARSARPEATPEVIRGRLGAFLFTGEDVFKKVGDLSGGQQNRLMLCKLVLSEPDVLIMDEPTNHLDIASREMLEEALCDYDGTIITVSHDRYFLDRVVDKLLVIGVDEYGGRQLGRFEFVTGENVYSRYASLVAQRVEAKEAAARRQASPPRTAAKQNQPVAKGVPPELRQFNRYTVEQLEEMILSLEEKLAELQEEFGDQKYYQNPELLAGLQENVRKCKEELDLLYRAYDFRLR